MIRSFLFSLLFCIAAQGQALTDSDLWLSADWVHAEGHWNKMDTTVDITCSKPAHFCVEARAWVEPSTRHVLIRSFVYAISRWESDGLTSHSGGPVSGDLLINLKSRSVTLVAHDKNEGDTAYSLLHGSTTTLDSR